MEPHGGISALLRRGLCGSHSLGLRACAPEVGGGPHQTQSLPGSGVQRPELGVSTGLFDGSGLCCSVMAAGLVEAALPGSPGPSTLKMQEARLRSSSASVYPLLLRSFVLLCPAE